MPPASGNRGIAVALEALPDPTSENQITRQLQYWPPAEVAFEAADRGLHELAVLEGHAGWVRTVTVTPDSSRIVSTSADRTARIWDARTGAELEVLAGHTDRVFGVAGTPDGRRIVSGAGDNTVRIWDV